MKVEELKMYGKALEMPKEAVKKQMKIVFRLLRKEFGVFGMLKLLIGIRKHSKRIKKQFPDAVKKARQISKVIEKELVMMGALFSAIADKRGRKIAQEFLIDMMRKTAATSLPALYQLPDLVKCEGDVFENYKKMNRAMFTTIHEQGTWRNDGFHETKDLLEFKVTSCANIELFEAIDCPELNILGCEHDLAAYDLINGPTNSEFRRHCTLAKGGDCCHFQFYRKGTAPVSAFSNK